MGGYDPYDSGVLWLRSLMGWGCYFFGGCLVYSAISKWTDLSIGFLVGGGVFFLVGIVIMADHADKKWNHDKVTPHYPQTEEQVKWMRQEAHRLTQNPPIFYGDPATLRFSVRMPGSCVYDIQVPTGQEWDGERIFFTVGLDRNGQVVGSGFQLQTISLPSDWYGEA